MDVFDAVNVQVALGLMAVLGGLVGAGLQHFFANWADRKRHQRELRANAYADYLRSIGEMEASTKIEDPGVRSEIFVKAVSAKVRVCAHGSEEAVKALARLEGISAPGLTDRKKQALLEFIAVIRRDFGHSGTLSSGDIVAILFPSDSV